MGNKIQEKMISLPKSLLAGALGVGGVSTISTAIYISPSTNLFKKAWRRSLEVDNPVIECADSEHTYKVFMKLTQGGAKELGLGITFEIQKISQNGEKQLDIFFGQKAVKADDWINFRLTWSGAGKHGIWFNSIEYRSYQGYNQVQKCKKSQIELEEQHKSTSENGIEITNLEFELDNNCKRGIGVMECGITIAKGKGLKLNDEFKPKMKFFAF